MIVNAVLKVQSPSNLLRRLASTSQTFTRTNFENGIKTITMCHSKTRNSLSLQMMQELLDNIREDADNSDLRVIVLTAEGPVFSAGHNLKELTADCGRNQQEKVFTLAAELMNSMVDAQVPIIARVDGLAAAAGCQLVAQCDLAFCSEKSSFSTPGANFGLFCSTPGVALARSVPKATALSMLLTGLPISAIQAEASGLVTKACKPEDLDKDIQTASDAIKGKSRAVVALGKQFYYKQAKLDVKTAYDLGGMKMVENLQLPDGQEGIRSFIEKRKPQWNK